MGNQDEYQTRPGAALAVGSPQSGCQVAEELLEHEREVYLFTGRSGWVSRRCRGNSAARWMGRMGLWDRTAG